MSIKDTLVIPNKEEVKMIKFLILIFLAAILLVSGYDWYYHESQHAAFNTGMYFVLVSWWSGMVVGEHI